MLSKSNLILHVNFEPVFHSLSLSLSLSLSPSLSVVFPFKMCVYADSNAMLSLWYFLGDLLPKSLQNSKITNLQIYGFQKETNSYIRRNKQKFIKRKKEKTDTREKGEGIIVPKLQRFGNLKNDYFGDSGIAVV